MGRNGPVSTVPSSSQPFSAFNPISVQMSSTSAPDSSAPPERQPVSIGHVPIRDANDGRLSDTSEAEEMDVDDDTAIRQNVEAPL